MENYEELEGKIIDCWDGDIYRKGLIAGCDPDIGITIVNAEDHNNYLACLKGPGSKLWERTFNKEAYEVTFKMMVGQFKTGIYKNHEIVSMRKVNFDCGEPTQATAQTCPFGQ